MNKFLKSTISLVLILALAVSFAACGKSDEPDSDLDSSDIGNAADSVFNMIDRNGKENSKVKIGDYVLVDENSFDWEATEEGAVLTAYTGTETVIELPAKVGGLDLVELGRTAFANTPVVAVKLPDTVKTVGVGSFAYVMTLVKIELGSGVETIEDSAFEGCSALSEINLVDSLRTIGVRAFGLCKSLKSVTLPKNLETLRAGAFCMAGGLESVTISGVPTITEQAFSSCTSLKTVVVEPGTTKIEYRAFEYCKELERVYLPASITEMSTVIFLGSDNVTLYVPEGSYAQTYAQEREKPYEIVD